MRACIGRKKAGGSRFHEGTGSQGENPCCGNTGKLVGHQAPGQHSSQVCTESTPPPVAPTYPGGGSHCLHDLGYLDGRGCHALVQHAHDVCKAETGEQGRSQEVEEVDKDVEAAWPCARPHKSIQAGEWCREITHDIGVSERVDQERERSQAHTRGKGGRTRRRGAAFFGQWSPHLTAPWRRWTRPRSGPQCPTPS